MSAAAALAETPFRPSAYRPGRVVGVRYTGFARPHRFQSTTMFGPAIEQALRAILERLDLAPEAVSPKALALGDVGLFARIPQDAAEERRPGTLQPVAFVTEGLTEAEIRLGLEALANQGWAP